MKRLLLVIRATPYGGIRAREALDAALLCSAFAPDIALLFSGDGVCQLVRGQRPEGIAAGSQEAMLGALAEYDITRVYADGAALSSRGLRHAPLLSGVSVLDDAGVRELLRAHDRVLTL